MNRWIAWTLFDAVLVGANSAMLVLNIQSQHVALAWVSGAMVALSMYGVGFCAHAARKFVDDPPYPGPHQH
jgi:hypothetical protein